jgi:hypothetical protein
MHYMEARIDDRVITLRSSLDLLVPNELLSQGCADMRGSPLTRPFLPDLEYGTGCGWLRCDSGTLRGRPQRDVPRLGQW